MTPYHSPRRTQRTAAGPADTALLFPELSTTVDQLAVVAARPNLLIRASAGTGKTYQLSGQFIDRLRITPPERILATTFTRAAAGEILERVLLRLAQAALDPQQLAQLKQQVDDWHDQPLTQRECLDRLATLTRELHRVRVGTLDSFFIQLAQSFSLELGLPPGWRILDDIEADQLVTQAIERLLARDTQGDVGRLLNLIGKGDAGRSVSNVLRQAVRQFYELYQQTEAAAWRRVPEPPPLAADDLQAAVFSLEAAHEHLRDDKRFEKAHVEACNLVADGDWANFLAKGIAGQITKGETSYYKKPIPEPVLTVYAKLVNHAQAILIRQLASRTRVTWELLDRFHGELRTLKDEQQGLTFSDVTRALGIGWSGGHIARLDFRLDAAIEHLLLDEFQDTSIPQWQALEPLALRATTDPGSSLFCVGDQKQAIYGWRGGVAELFDSIERRLPRIKDQPLARSYRSSPAVIEAVNRVCQNLHLHRDLGDAAPAVHRWQQRYDLHATERSELPGCVTLETYPDSETESELDNAARRIADMHRRIPRATIGVLAVKNDTVATLAQSLRRLGIEASEEGGSELTDCVAVQVILSLLQFLDHPGDSAARFHVAKSPVGISLGLSEDIDDDRSAALAEQLRRQLLERGYGPCVAGWAEGLAPHCDERGVSRLVQLVDLAHQYSPFATLRPREFVEFIEAQRVVQPSAARVRLMTIHRSKGLEFDVVFLPELDSDLVQKNQTHVTGHPAPVEPADTVIRYANRQLVGLLPEELQRVFVADKERKIEERLCVLYVALTRARHALHLLIAPSKQTESKLSLTMAHLLRASLTDGQRLPPEFQRTITGNLDWWTRVPGLLSATDEQPTAVKEQPHLEIALGTPGSGGMARLEAVQPSRHRGQLMKITDALVTESAVGRTRGVLMHAWFERLTWLDDGPQDDDALRRMATRLEPHGLDINRCLRDFHAMLRSPDIAWTLSQRAYLAADGLFSSLHAQPASAGGVSLRVKTERHFAVPLQDEMVRGCIDRLVLFQREDSVLAADIIDYKTDALDKLSAESLTERLDGYRTQLHLYRRAVAHLYQLPAARVTARLIFLGPGRVEPVE